MSSVLDTLERWTALHPEKLLYSFLDADGEEVERHSYRTFLDRLNLLAGHLVDRERQLKAGDRVLLVYQPGLEMVAALFACARAGLIPVPVPPPGAIGSAAALYRMRHISRDCSAAAVLTSRACVTALGRSRDTSENGIGTGSTDLPVTANWIVTDTLSAPAAPLPPSNQQNVLLLQYTSGSTSSPKGVVVTHANVLHNCALAVDHAAPTTVSWLPQHHDMGLLGYYVYIALSGGTTYGFSPSSFIQRPALWLETITKYRATASSAPNFAFEACLRHRSLSDATMATIELSSLRYLMAAAEPIKPDTYRRFLQKFEPYGLKAKSFFVAYGLAENTLAVTNYGRSTISVNKRKLSQGLVQVTQDVAGVTVAAHLMSCGKPLPGNTVRIVHPQTQTALSSGVVGEIWIRGESTSPGYWNAEALTREAFYARIDKDDDETAHYLRTGDMGFFHDGELYVCGRQKDMIIVRGQNVYPQDIEAIVERTSSLVRPGGVAAFELENAPGAPIAVVAEVKRTDAHPDARTIAAEIRESLGISVGVIAFVPSKTVPRTSSGKIQRYKTRQMYLAGQLRILGEFCQPSSITDAAHLDSSASSPFDALKRRYQLTGDEPQTLIEIGMDSIDLVVFLHELKVLLETQSAHGLAEQVDVRLIQRVSVATLFRLVEDFSATPDVAVSHFQSMLEGLREQHRAEEHGMMIADRTLAFPTAELARSSGQGLVRSRPRQVPGEILLTGGTGFLGPFVLRSLLEQSSSTIRVLMRASSPDEARGRLRTALADVVGPSTELLAECESRVVPVCGDLEEPGLGLSRADWSMLADNVECIYHNAATVNYLFNYASMRAANVAGTDEVLRLAFEGSRKQVNHISTTFVFGWATKAVLYESDANEEMQRLDFGYSQTKWVAEQKVMDAARHGLETRIFRPSLVTPSVSGGGTSVDITIRLIAFMIKHGIGVDALNQVSFVPADVTANNIVAIANQPSTVGGTFHVTRDEYGNMSDVTSMISMQTGRRFDLFPLRDFVPEIVRRCTKDDLLYPLLDFLIGSVDNISAMEYKRYDNASYRLARDASPRGVREPSLDDTVRGILTFMARNGIA